MTDTKSNVPGNADTSLFKRLGGYEAVNRAVDLFYDRVLADAALAPFFESVNMGTQRAKQRRFLAHVFGGPVPWEGTELRHVHRHMSIEPAHFDGVVRHLQSALVELGVGEREIDEVMSIAESARDDVLNR